MSDAAAIKRSATHQDVLDAPPHMVAEIVHSALHLHPRPAPRHSVAYSALGGELHGPFQRGRGGPGGWWILDEPEVHRAEHVLVADLAGWRRERLPKLPETAWFEVAPNWVCEVLAPSTRALDLGEKRQVYAEQVVAHLWLVDPDARTLEAFTLEKGSWRLIATLVDEADVSMPPFDETTFDLAALWP